MSPRAFAIAFVAAVLAFSAIAGCVMHYAFKWAMQ